LNLALKVVAVTHGGIAVGFRTVAKAKWLAPRLSSRAVVQGLGTLDLCAGLAGISNGATRHLLYEATDLARNCLLHRLKLPLSGGTHHLLVDDLGAAEFDTVHLRGG